MISEFKLPDIGEGVAEGEIVKWLIEEGHYVIEDDHMVEVMTDKVTVEITSPFTGYVQELKAVTGEIVRVGSVIVVFSTEKEAPAKREEVLVQKSTKQTQEKEGNGDYRNYGDKVLAAPATRKLAREIGVNLEKIHGTGPRNRILPEDVKGYVAANKPSVQKPKIEEKKLVETLTQQHNERRIPYLGMRRKIGDNLTKSKFTIPHYAYVEEVDMTNVVNLRNELSQHIEENLGVKFNYLPIIIKAVVEAVKKFPEINSSLDETTNEIIIKEYFNFGIAVSTSRGLVVPIVKNVDQKSIKVLTKEIDTLSSAAREDRLSIEDVSNGTFTITSIGSIGGFISIPIINYPQAAIMGINRISKRPVVRNNEIVIRDMMNLSMSLDHRLIDGATAALFAKSVAEYLENPALMMINL